MGTASLCLLVAVGCSEPAGPESAAPVFDAPQLSHTDAGTSNGLVGHWQLDADGQDSGPNGLHGTLVGTFPTETDQDGAAGGALSFGWLRNVEIPTDALLNFSEDFSLMFWMKSSGSGPVEVIAHKGRDVFNTYEFVRFGSDVVIFYVRPLDGGPVQQVSGSVPFDSEWHHVAATVDNGVEMRLYVDGTLVSTFAMTSTFAATNHYPLVLGRHYTQANGGGGFEYQYNGSLDDFRAYDRALDACEVGAIAGNPCDPPTKDACKKGGWETYGFRNQGQCVRFVETGKDSRD